MLEHVGERIELTTSQGRLALERVQEPGTSEPGFIRLMVGAYGAERAVIHLNPGGAEDLAELLRLLAGQIVGHRWSASGCSSGVGRCR